MIEAIRHRAGLLQSEDGKSFQFTYRFQEFLAGGFLADNDAWEKDQKKGKTRGQVPSFAKRAAYLFEATGYWRNVITWAAGIRAHVRHALGDVRDLIHELSSDPSEDAFGRRKLVFAADLVRDVRLRDLLDLTWGPETVDELRRRLGSVIESPEWGRDYPLKERLELNSLLNWIGDTREGVGIFERPGEKAVPDLAWTKVIENGEFSMGEERSPHRIEHPFCVARYPVTVGQYELFIQDGGYEREELWTPEGWNRPGGGQRKRPEDYDSIFQCPNHPRVGVSGYEAMAYCMWLNASFTWEELKLPEKEWKVRLSSEAEWERAARHTDGRTYTWGNETENLSKRCNIRETGVGHTSAVGMFPRGRAVCDAEDLSGNVWEWCMTEVGSAPRVLRGGSWYNDADLARCAFRLWYIPDFRNSDFGFRVVSSPFSGL